MSTTDDLRRMLDERGVEWFAPEGPRHDRRTEFGVIGGWDYCADESQWGYGIDLMAACCVETPEQAIEATLGRGECRNEGTGTIAFKCSECGCWVAYDEDWSTDIYAWRGDVMKSIFPRYCPNCGRKVVLQSH